MTYNFRSRIFCGVLFLLLLLITSCGQNSSTAPPSAVGGGNTSSGSTDHSAGIVLYVAPGGDDTHSGLFPVASSSPSGALATLDGARLAVRALRQQGKTGTITVEFRGGVYRLADTVQFTSEDSGLPGAPTIYRNYPEETVVLSGADQITQWTNGGGDRWTAKLPAGLNALQLFLGLGDSSRRFRPRIPQQGFLYVAATPGVTSSTGMYSGSDSFQYQPGQFDPSWKNLSNVSVVLRYWWTSARLPIKSIDDSTHTVTFTKSTSMRLSDGGYFAPQGPRYHIENVYEAMVPGQFYFDQPTSTLIYETKPGEDLTGVVGYIPRLQNLVILDGGSNDTKVHDIVFNGLGFQHTFYALPPDFAGDGFGAYEVPGAIRVRAANDITIRNCTFEHLGTSGIGLTYGATNVVVDHNLLFDLGGDGIRILEEVDPQAVAGVSTDFGHTITNNTIHDFGMRYHDAVGILVGGAYGNLIAHNEIYNGHYSGIAMGWSMGYDPTPSKDNIVTENLIHNIGKPTWISDLSGIYTSGMSPGTVISNNVVHDVFGRYGAYGLYADEGTSYVTFRDNVVYHTQSSGFILNYGKENRVSNNIFYSQSDAQLDRYKQEDHLSLTFTNNIVAYGSGRLQIGHWEDAGVASNQNLYYRYGGTPLFGEHELTFAQWQQLGKDVDSNVADPCFSDPDHGDFTLCPQSPATSVGFHPIDVTAVGPTTSTDQMQALPVVTH